MARPAAPCDRETIRLSGGDDRAPGSRRVLTEERDGDGAASSPERRVSQTVVPGATLIAVAALAAVWAASGLLRERSLAIAVLLVAAGCWLGAIVVAHVAAGVAARVAHRSGTSR